MQNNFQTGEQRDMKRRTMFTNPLSQEAYIVHFLCLLRQIKIRIIWYQLSKKKEYGQMCRMSDTPSIIDVMALLNCTNWKWMLKQESLNFACCLMTEQSSLIILRVPQKTTRKKYLISAALWYPYYYFFSYPVIPHCAQGTVRCV